MIGMQALGTPAGQLPFSLRFVQRMSGGFWVSAHRVSSMSDPVVRIFLILAAMMGVVAIALFASGVI